MSTLTDQEKAQIESKHFIVLRTNIGPYEQGAVVTGKQLGADNVQRQLWGKHVREATEVEAPLQKVTITEGKEELLLSYEHRLSRLESENNRLRRELVDLQSRNEVLVSQAQPRPPSQNEQASMALVMSKERRIKDLEAQTSAAQQEADRLRAENQQVLQRLQEAQEEKATRPEHPPQTAQTVKTAQPEQGQKKAR